eukprot:Skav213881  [mRNA]  locus=scaffold2374:182641:183546:- [translate_table: standard]
MADVSPPQSFCGDAEACPGIRSGFIRSRSNEESLFEASSVIAPESANLLSPRSPALSPVSSQLTSVERLELQKLRQEVADLRTELAKGNRTKTTTGNFDKGSEGCEGNERYRVAEGWASAASAASTALLSSPETGTSRSSEVPSPSPGPDGYPDGRRASQGCGRWDWVLQERAYCFARDFFLDSPTQRTRGEFEAAVGEVPDIAVFFSEHFPRFFSGERSEVLDWNDFVQAYVQLCRKRKSMAQHEAVCSAATGCVSDVNEGRMRHQRPAAFLTSQDYQGIQGSCDLALRFRWRLDLLANS